MFIENYERKLKGNSLILTNQDETSDSNDFEERMITENRIKGFITCSKRINDGNTQFVYDITSKQSYEMLFAEKELREADIRKLILGIVDVRNELNEYLLSDENLVLKPKFLYADPETKTPFFVFFPYYGGDIKNSLLELGMFILERTNHDDEAAVALSYGFYKFVVSDNFAFEKLFDRVNNELQENHNTTEPEEKEVNSIIEDQKSEIQIYDGRVERNSDYIEKIVLLMSMIILVIMILIVIGIKYFKLENAIFVNKRWLIGIICFMAAICIMAPVVMIVNKVADKNRRKRFENISNSVASIEKKKKERILNQNNMYGKTEEIGEADVKYRLVCYEDENIVEVNIDKWPCIIGKSREEADKCLDFKEISRIHAKLFKQSEEVFIMDCNSTNGTSVNGRMLAANESIKLHENDSVSLGGKVFYFR